MYLEKVKLENCWVCNLYIFNNFDFNERASRQFCAFIGFGGGGQNWYERSGRLQRSLEKTCQTSRWLAS